MNNLTHVHLPERIWKSLTELLSSFDWIYTAICFQEDVPTYFSGGKSPLHLSMAGGARHAQMQGTFAPTACFLEIDL